MEWMARKNNQVNSRRPRATWAAVALAICSLFVQVTNFVRVDLKPLMDLAQQNSASLKRIEEKLLDHDHRLQRLEVIAESNRSRIVGLEQRRK